MSKIDNNPLLQGLSGMLGNTMVYRQVNGQMQMVNKPKRRKFNSESQEEFKLKFQEAVQYAKKQSGDPESKALYETGITDKKRTAYTVALTDYLRSPKVHFIDAQDYLGQVNDLIVVKATDDFMVTGVKIFITASDGSLIEKGEATPDPKRTNEFFYKVTEVNPSVPGTRIKATAYDRPGNTGSLEKVV
ncbi:MAG TPA: hypothetical protein PLR06_01220 [Cyclobacteriaceae bacterium]|nr:hypothetical protein [Cyclobacteriaceae bacterium]